jgi:hypothetical protein
MPLPRSRPLSPTEQGNQMLNHDTVREATRLTRAGQLIEATALLQRMLRGESTPESSGTPPHVAPARLEPPTIELEAKVVGDRESPQTTQSSSAGPRRKSLAPFYSMKDFSGLRLRGSIRHVPPSTLDIAPKDGRFIERTFSNAAGSRTYKLFIPSHYRGQPLPLICDRHTDEFPG